MNAVRAGSDIGRRVLPALFVVAVATACRPTAGADTAPAYVGSAACGECHVDVADRVAAGVHPRAMQNVTDSSVLGSFDSAQLTHFGVTSEFFHRSGRPMVRTDGADGSLKEFEVTHALGVSPLQQYLVRFPDGRYQVLPIAWDTRPDSAMCSRTRAAGRRGTRRSQRRWPA